MSRLLFALMALLMLTLGTAPGDARAAPRQTPAPRPRGAAQAAAPARRRAAPAPAPRPAGPAALRSAAVMVQDQASGDVILEKNAGAVLPIASITKLMTAMVALEAQPDLDEVLTIGEEDVDTLKGSSSRLRVGTRLTREELLCLALMSSENRAASALSRYYPGGRDAFVAAMNRKAQWLGLADTRFLDPTGLAAANVSSARDLARLVAAASEFPLIRRLTTTADRTVSIRGRPHAFHNTNSLVRSPAWAIGLSKTGYINEAGRCLVMQALFNDRPVIIVLLDSWGRLTRIGDANRIRRMIEGGALRGRLSAG